jgi:hypothetical protein
MESVLPSTNMVLKLTPGAKIGIRGTILPGFSRTAHLAMQKVVDINR